MAPYALKKNRWGAKMGNDEVVDLMIYDGLWDIFNNYHMGVTAENVAEKYKITREEQDEFSAISQNKAEAAIKAGKFKDEIVPVGIPQPKGEPVLFDTDEFPGGGLLHDTGRLQQEYECSRAAVHDRHFGAVQIDEGIVHAQSGQCRHQMLDGCDARTVLHHAGGQPRIVNQFCPRA